ncbi:MAG: bifunctional adenosylcobinamide kinase/adenosylcobinamide-phosphate guanylyltransferase [Bacillota bacterium]|jgi:adenosylcobinamide kinase/adenosylcobinamide-phosphate guanylyltransferase
MMGPLGNKKIIFITGGARSGKSSFAEDYAAKSGGSVLYIATALPIDEEMEKRIAYHRKNRPSTWYTVEAYKNIDSILEEIGGSYQAVLLDCLTVMINNLIFPFWREDLTLSRLSNLENKVMEQLNALLEASFAGQLIIVSNELGCGLVPDSPLGRFFRDVAGRANQRVAAKANEVFLLVSGIPMRIK